MPLPEAVREPEVREWLELESNIDPKCWLNRTRYRQNIAASEILNAKIRDVDRDPTARADV